MKTIKSLNYHLTVQVQKGILHVKHVRLLGNSDCWHSSQHNKDIEVIEIPLAYIIAYKHYLELLNFNENLYLASRHGSLSYI